MVQKLSIFIKIKHLYLETSLQNISKLAEENEIENTQFINHLLQMDKDWIDTQTQQLNSTIELAIDCTTCGNCCKTLMINVEPKEVEVASAFLAETTKDFKDKFIEQGSSGQMIMNTIPCHFLENQKCSIYEARFSGCKEFPGLHLPNIKARLFTVMMHYNRCPIIFNVVEQLKQNVHQLNQ
ncbi:MAG: YkgJ family cysteine cluster protein [Chitinophagaceae bacterium]